MIKIGRNDSCWCGSGKKYKQCHMNLDHEPISPDEFLAGMKKTCRLAAQILKTVGQKVAPGVSTQQIDQWVLEMTLDAGAYPAPLNYPNLPTDPRNPKIGPGGFPASVCTSVNEVVCHGIPSQYVLKEGDIVNIDVTNILDGYFGDTNATFPVGEIDTSVKDLIETNGNKPIEEIKRLIKSKTDSYRGKKTLEDDFTLVLVRLL